MIVQGFLINLIESDETPNIDLRSTLSEKLEKITKRKKNKFINMILFNMYI